MTRLWVVEIKEDRKWEPLHGCEFYSKRNAMAVMVERSKHSLLPHHFRVVEYVRRKK